jgi:undecaprenyl-diphosphatase
MNYFQAALLGVIQGITEFLPVSSSGHLVIFQKLLGFVEPQLTFDIFLHFCTLLAVIIFFWKDLLKLKIKHWLVIGAGTVPTMIAGLFFKNIIEGLFASSLLVAVALILTGIMNLLSDKKLDEKETSTEITFKQGLLIGIFQALAITPGISRSGATLFGGLIQKINRREAFKFSFYLSIPAIFGATILQTLDVLKSGIGELNWPIFIVGGVFAFGAGLLSLGIFKYIIEKAKLEIFGWYCLGAGSLFLISNFI